MGIDGAGRLEALKARHTGIPGGGAVSCRFQARLLLSSLRLLILFFPRWLGSER